MEKELLWRATGMGSKSRTRAEKAKAQAEYTEVNKQLKRSIRTDKPKYVEGLATTAEKAETEGNMRQLYDTTNKLSGNRRKPERPVKRKEGEVITNTEEQQNRWVEHFKDLLHRPGPLNPPDIDAAPTDLSIDVGPPTIEEISMAIRQIKSGRAEGPDNIPAEKLKADVAATACIFHILFSKVWDEEQVPTDWKEGLLEERNSVAAAPAAVGFNLHKGKIKILRYNTACTNPITIDGDELEDVETFTYFGNIIDEHGGSDANASQDKLSHGILKAKGKEEDQRTHYAEKW
ncbi:unnamed protein product [Schistosoma mattheei]|uniref:Uncharacterized protein n=1 Tax=Schistosoma mattheei TaxID=31246 RepID=A0A183P5V1_9TREM|nr:unnamed protein product [Schistosoma mattheei]